MPTGGFAAEQQSIFCGRARGIPPPWTSDRILSRHKFTNVYRVSQYLIRDVIYAGPQEAADLVFRVLLFKLFTRMGDLGAAGRRPRRPAGVGRLRLRRL